MLKKNLPLWGNSYLPQFSLLFHVKHQTCSWFECRTRLTSPLSVRGLWNIKRRSVVFFRRSAWQMLDKTAAACVVLHRTLVARCDHPPNNTVRVCWSYCHAAASRRFLCLDPNGFLWPRVAGQYVGGRHVCCNYQGSTDSSYWSAEKC